MLAKPLDQISEADLIGLQREQIAESIRLEFKRQLNTGTNADKLEAAKDVSALANSVGGRIVYGIDEVELPDGSKAAGQLVPMSDGVVQEALENIINSAIQPRPRFRIQKVSVTGGFVLILEVYPSYDRDLHMVIGYKESRFYRRGEQSTLRMTEPEIREAYSRVAVSAREVEASLERCMQSELSRVPETQESVFVIPVFGHRRLVEPQQLGANFGHNLANGPINFARSFSNNVVHRLRITNDGYRAWLPEDCETREANAYAAILRTGVVHLAHSLYYDDESHELRLSSRETVECLISAILIAKEVFNRCAYWGPIRVIHRLAVDAVTVIDELVGNRRRFPGSTRGVILTGQFKHETSETHWDEISSGSTLVLRDMLDQLFQTAGEVACPWFDAGGNLTNETPVGIQQLMACMP